MLPNGDGATVGDTIDESGGKPNIIGVTARVAVVFLPYYKSSLGNTGQNLSLTFDVALDTLLEQSRISI